MPHNSRGVSYVPSLVDQLPLVETRALIERIVLRVAAWPGGRQEAGQSMEMCKLWQNWTPDQWPKGEKRTLRRVGIG